MHQKTQTRIFKTAFLMIKMENNPYCHQQESGNQIVVYLHTYRIVNTWNRFACIHIDKPHKCQREHNKQVAE